MKRLRATAGRLTMAASQLTLAASLAASLAVSLAGCESGARQDPFPVRPSDNDIVFSDVPIFRDRTLDEAIVSSGELTDYAVALDKAGLLDTLRRAGPFTVFAVPNQPLEAEQRAAFGQLLSPESHAGLRRLLAYSIVPGRYTEAKLRRMIASQKGPIRLTTLDGRDGLGVSMEPGTGQLLLSDPQGHANRLWLVSVPQSNGVLYATQSLLLPADNVIASAAMAPSGMTYVPGDFNTGVGARH